MDLGTILKPRKSGVAREMQEVSESVVYIPLLKTVQCLLDKDEIVAEVRMNGGVVFYNFQCLLLD